MECPACFSEMVEKDFGGVMVDVCENGCKGLWFDWMELVKMDERHEGAGEALAQAMESPRANDETRGQLKCPKCSLPMHVHLFKRSRSVNVDECYHCGGFFLDSGELLLIRENYMSDEENRQYVQQLMEDIPGFKEYETDLEKRFVRAKAMMKMTRFIRPSYFIPKALGKTPPEEQSYIMRDYLTKYNQDPNSIRTPEMRALLEEYKRKLGVDAEDKTKWTPEMRAIDEELRIA